MNWMIEQWALLMATGYAFWAIAVFTITLLCYHTERLNTVASAVLTAVIIYLVYSRYTVVYTGPWYGYILLAITYLSVGIVYSVIRWFLVLHDFGTTVVKLKKEAVQNYQDNKHNTMPLDQFTGRQLAVHFGKSSYIDESVELKYVLSRCAPVLDVERTVFHIIWWPVSLIVWATRDWAVNLGKYVYNLVSGIYKSMRDSMLQSLE